MARKSGYDGADSGHGLFHRRCDCCRVEAVHSRLEGRALFHGALGEASLEATEETTILLERVS
jgi:hypothetical protein